MTNKQLQKNSSLGHTIRGRSTSGESPSQGFTKLLSPTPQFFYWVIYKLWGLFSHWWVHAAPSLIGVPCICTQIRPLVKADCLNSVVSYSALTKGSSRVICSLALRSSLRTLFNWCCKFWRSSFSFSKSVVHIWIWWIQWEKMRSYRARTTE